MATFPLVFPSLTRQPSMDTSKTAEDDTIRDQMEQGYVATRPRFTRARRTWKLNVRNLQAEDIRALDAFFMAATGRGGNSFLYPNLLQNWSFEFPALTADEIACGWSSVLAANPLLVPVITSLSDEQSYPNLDAWDGVQTLRFSTGVGSLVGSGEVVAAQINSTLPIACTPGEVYIFTAQVNRIQGALADPSTIIAAVTAVFSDAYGNQTLVNGPGITTADGWQAYGFNFTAPANAVSFTIALKCGLNAPMSGSTDLDGSASILFDAVCCSLLTPITPYGRMVGSQPLGCLVRFSKLPEMADIGWANGQKVYGATFELQEV